MERILIRKGSVKMPKYDLILTAEIMIEVIAKSEEEAINILASQSDEYKKDLINYVKPSMYKIKYDYNCDNRVYCSHCDYSTHSHNTIEQAISEAYNVLPQYVVDSLNEGCEAICPLCNNGNLIVE